MSSEAQRGVLRARLDQEIELLLVAEILNNLKDWREAQAQFRDVKAQLLERETARGLSYLIAEQRAAVHPRMREAVAFTDYYGSQVRVAAAALTALRGVREDLKR